MSTTTHRPTTTEEPQPWRTPEDRKGWRPVPRVRRGSAGPPLVSVEVDFDQAQSEWLAAEADRTGLNYVALVKKLVDDARTQGAT
jgi:hypothetical protein